MLGFKNRLAPSESDLKNSCKHLTDEVIYAYATLEIFDSFLFSSIPFLHPVPKIY